MPPGMYVRPDKARRRARYDRDQSGAPSVRVRYPAQRIRPLFYGELVEAAPLSRVNHA